MKCYDVIIIQAKPFRVDSYLLFPCNWLEQDSHFLNNNADYLQRSSFVKTNVGENVWWFIIRKKKIETDNNAVKFSICPALFLARHKRHHVVREKLNTETI